MKHLINTAEGVYQERELRITEGIINYKKLFVMHTFTG
jgi:hypothetical protein